MLRGAMISENFFWTTYRYSQCFLLTSYGQMRQAFRIILCTISRISILGLWKILDLLSNFYIKYAGRCLLRNVQKQTDWPGVLQGQVNRIPIHGISVGCNIRFCRRFAIEWPSEFMVPTCLCPSAQGIKYPTVSTFCAFHLCHFCAQDVFLY